MILNPTIIGGGIDPSDATATAADILASKTAYIADGTKATGTIQTKTSSDLTASGATVSVPAGYYASQSSKAVASGTEGTPTASKSVSGSSATVTPSVTNSAGYISGGTKTGTPVVVTASELVSGTKTIAQNGSSINVIDFAYVDVNVQPPLQNKTVSPKVGQQTVQKDTDYYGLGTVTLESIPASQITLIIPNWVAGASITYNGTTYTSGQAIQMFATEKFTLTMPAAGATAVINGTHITLTGTSIDIVLFANAILNMTGTSPYRVDFATMDGIGGRVPVEYIFLAWEAYTGAMSAVSGFTYAELLILENASYTTIGFLQSGFTVTAYNDTTGEFSGRGWYAASYNKSTKQWTLTDYTSAASSGEHYFANGKFTTTLITYGGETVFPTFKTSGGGGGGPNLASVLFGQNLRSYNVANDVYIKYDQAPSSANDYNVHAYSGEYDTQVTVDDGYYTVYVPSEEWSVARQTYGDIYIWGTTDGPETFIDVNGVMQDASGGATVMNRDYTNPLHINVSEPTIVDIQFTVFQGSWD